MLQIRKMVAQLLVVFSRENKTLCRVYDSINLPSGKLFQYTMLCFLSSQYRLLTCFHKSESTVTGYSIVGIS